jgi:phosphonate transport system permease protein
MSDNLTLDQVTPEMALSRKAFLGVLTLIITAVLVLSWMQTEMDPVKLYTKRANAWSYLFGRDLKEFDHADARSQAERLPEVIAREEARQDVRAMEKEGRVFQGMARQRKIESIAEARLKSVSVAERDALVEEEYERIVDEKRGGFFPPETRWSKVQTYVESLLETVAIAIWGTLLAFIAAVPLSMFAARNTLGLMVQGDGPVQRAVRWFGYVFVRRILDFCRGFNEFVMALIFVAVIGLGPFAGVLALAIHTVGVLGKVFSEGIEAIEPGQVEAVEAGGASAAQVIVFSVLPQIMPLVVSYSLLRFESNVRSATILGFVGAGGIGFLMYDKLNGYLYREVCTMMILVIVSVTVIDFLCGKLRARFV